MTFWCSDAEQTTGVRDLRTIYFLSGVSYRFGGNTEMSTFHTSLGVYFLHINRYIIVYGNGKNGPLINADFVTLTFADFLIYYICANQRYGVSANPRTIHKRLYINPKPLYQLYQVGPIHPQHLCGLSAVAITLPKGMLNEPTAKPIH